MKKKFIGIICILYSSIILYIILTNQLKNYLAPQIQIYIKVLVIPMIILGIIMLFNKHEYKLKASDLILIIPLVLIIIASNARLSTSFASNRTTTINYKNRVKTEVKEEIEEETINEYVEFKPYFEIEDSNYDSLASYITFAPKADKFVGKTIKVQGFVLRHAEYLQSGYFSIGKYSISCCVADAGYTGFIVKENDYKIEENKWYDIEGILRKGQDKEGYNILYIEIVNIKKINSKNQEQYVYPCYAYDANCSSVVKYDLEY